MLTAGAPIARMLASGSLLAKVVACANRLHHEAKSAAGKLGGWLLAGAAQAKANAARIRSDRLPDRVAAAGSFAAIALFAALSIDALLGGGLDLGSKADAAQPGRRYVALAALPEIPYQPPAYIAAAPPETARVLAVSYSPAGEQLLGGLLPGEEQEMLADSAQAPNQTSEIAAAPGKLEANLSADIVKTVPF